MGAFLLLAIGVIVGWAANSVMFKYTISENPDKMIDMLENLKQVKTINQKMKNPTVSVVIEKHGKQWYAFIEDSHTFLGQSDSVDGVIDKITDKYPDYNFSIDSEKPT